jgi:hypothetical protein
VQLSLFGLLGVLAGAEEGLELNVLSLTFGIDVKRPALKLPVVGRLGFSQRLETGAPDQAASTPPRATRRSAE